MRQSRWVRVIASVLAVTMVAIGCGGESDSVDSGDEEPLFADIESAVFTNPTVIDNDYFPLTPGTRLVLRGVTIEEGEALAHRIEFITTDLTKEIAGVETVVAWIEDYSEARLVEAEVAFYAQDDEGNVWFFGEYPEEYEDGEIVDAPAWISGFEDARAGVKMYGDPDPSAPPLYQGWGPEVGWSDFGKVRELGAEDCVELDCYEDVLIVAESSLGEEGIFQLKSYARGVGEIRVDFTGPDETQEQLEAVELTTVSPEELQEYRLAALDMEARANEASPDAYGQTPPMK